MISAHVISPVPRPTAGHPRFQVARRQHVVARHKMARSDASRRRQRIVRRARPLVKTAMHRHEKSAAAGENSVAASQPSACPLPGDAGRADLMRQASAQSPSRTYAATSADRSRNCTRCGGTRRMNHGRDAKARRRKSPASSPARDRSHGPRRAAGCGFSQPRRGTHSQVRQGSAARSMHPAFGQSTRLRPPQRTRSSCALIGRTACCCRSPELADAWPFDVSIGSTP
jgi:hypothetical protein